MTSHRMSGLNGRLGIRTEPLKGTVTLYDEKGEVSFQVTHPETLRDVRRGDADANEVEFRFRTFVRELEILLDRNGFERNRTEEQT